MRKLKCTFNFALFTLKFEKLKIKNNFYYFKHML